MRILRAIVVLLGCVAALPAASGLPRDVTIYRDTYGVPHIYGKTDADVAFGLMYAQAEDNFWQLEADLIRIVGRAAEVDGAAGLAGDLVVRAWQAVEHAQEQYRNADPKLRALCDGFAAGLNHYLKTHPNVKPRLLTHFEPWFILATEHRGPAGRGITRAERERAFPILKQFPADDASLTAELRLPGDVPPQELGEGSNMWAISGRRTTTGKPMLLINPHVGFFGGGQRYEAHLSSHEGLEVSGFAILGTPYIRSGHNRYLAWSHTNNYAFTSDVYREAFDDPAQPLAYRYAGGHKTAEQWTSAVRIRTPAGVQSFDVRFRKTHHGPVLGLRGDVALAVRAVESEGGSMEQRWAMARARNLQEFQAALARVALTGSNTIYADSVGNIFYVHGNGLPRRNPRLDWSGAMDGSVAETEWQGRHKLEDLPQVLNPASGWLQNCNSTPFLTTEGPENPKREAFPAYMAPEPDTPRSRRSRDILAGDHKFTFEEFTKVAQDTKIGLAKDRLPELLVQFKELQAVDPARTVRLRVVLDELKAWDQNSDVASVPATWFLEMESQAVQLRRTAAGDAYLLISALEKGLASLEKVWGTNRVAWGELNRLQRVHTSGTEQPFSDARPSLAMPGVPSFGGSILTYGADPVAGEKRRYGVRGNTYLAVVDLGQKLTARSLLVFGQSADPASPHHTDQAKLYSTGKFKPAWFEEREVKKNAERRYRVQESKKALR